MPMEFVGVAPRRKLSPNSPTAFAVNRIIVCLAKYTILKALTGPDLNKDIGNRLTGRGVQDTDVEEHLNATVSNR